ncbi:MAG: TetR/AcrR family transcriptional regulator [Gammaproteobacteria bacterium]
MARRNDKRTRLVEAADQLFHQQGVSNTTLANIAALAEVPLGNVYYYFKSKDSIILAVIDRRKRSVQSLFSQWNESDNVKTRLQAFINHALTLAEEAAQFGDSLGSLCQELGKQGGNIGEAASGLMQDVLNWCETQFIALGRPEPDAKKLALNLVASLQGISLITLTFRDPSFINRQNEFLNQWLETV